MDVRRLGPMTPELFRSEVLSGDEPVVVSGMLASWGAMTWTLQTFSAAQAHGGDATARAAFRRRDMAGPVWETDCVQRDVTLRAFARWVVGDPVSEDGWESEVGHDTHWGYVSYARMAELFAQHPDMMDESAVDWRAVGLEGSFGWDTNFWFGSSGAVTHLHYDVYGSNVVAQLFGAKRWTMFPPGHDGMRPTRVPYEESSVFSEVDPAVSDRAGKHGSLSRDVWERRRVATVGAGDVLFVPRHWWHHVEAMTTSISVNRWVPDVEHDAAERVSEGLTRLLVSGLRDWAVVDSADGDGGPSHWLNPTEEVSE
jgi:HSPB1-associated protein 1